MNVAIVPAVEIVYSSPSVRLVPIGYDPATEGKQAAALCSLTFPTWRAALDYCDEHGIAVFNRAAVEHAISTEQPSLPLSGVA